MISDDLQTAVTTIKKEPGKDIWLFGGASLVSCFMNEGLVDELMLAVHPVLLGSGKSLFQNLGSRTKLTLTDTKTYDTGLVQLYLSNNSNQGRLQKAVYHLHHAG